MLEFLNRAILSMTLTSLALAPLASAQETEPADDNPFLVGQSTEAETSSKCQAIDDEMDRAICEGRSLEDLAIISARESDEAQLRLDEAERRADEAERRANESESAAATVTRIVDAVEVASGLSQSVDEVEPEIDAPFLPNRPVEARPPKE